MRPPRDEAFANDVRAALIRRRGTRVWPLLLVLVVCLGAGIAWAHYAVIEEVTAGSGRIIASSQTQVVQPLEGGRIAAIEIAEGDIVEAGQVLLRIDDTDVASQLGELRQRRLALTMRGDRLRAEATGTPLRFSVRGRQAEDLVSGERALYAARQAALARELSVIDQVLAQRRLEKVELETRLDETRGTIELLDRELGKARELQKLGAYPEMDLLRLERQARTEKTEIAVLDASLPRAAAAIEEAEARRASAMSGFRAKAHEDLTATLSDLSVLEQTLRSAEDKVRRTVLKAPVHGIVNKLMVTTLGAVVRPGESIAELVPLDDTLLVEARIRPKDVAFVRPGQEASVKVTAYDFTIYGDLPGRVERISADSIADEEGRTYYRVVVRTEKTFLGEEKDSLPLIPGMVVSVSILTGERTVLNYLLKPIIKARSEAFRER